MGTECWQLQCQWQWQCGNCVRVATAGADSRLEPRTQCQVARATCLCTGEKLPQKPVQSCQILNLRETKFLLSRPVDDGPFFALLKVFHPRRARRARGNSISKLEGRQPSIMLYTFPILGPPSRCTGYPPCTSPTIFFNRGRGHEHGHGDGHSD